MQYSEKSIITESRSPSKEYLITCRLTRNEYNLLGRLRKLMKLNSSQIIRMALLKMRKELH